MTTLDNVIFIDDLPKLDLHGLDRDAAKLYIREFINDNKKMKNDIIVIVHGIGQGILKKATHDYLRIDKNVLIFQTYYNNVGCTIVRLKI